MKKLTTLLIGGVLVLGVFVGGAFLSGSLPTSLTSFLSASDLGEQRVVALSAGAFGNLSGITSDEHEERSQSGGGGGMAASGLGGGGGDGGMAADMSAEDEWIPTVYVYETSTALPALPESVDVLKRLPNIQRINGKSWLQSLSGGLLNTSRFSDIEPSYVTLVENHEYGYSLNFDASTGTLSISKNWNKWPNPAVGCGDETCGQQNNIKASDVPADAMLISTAGSWLAELGIDTSIYGEPTVNNDWRTQPLYGMAESERWIPEEASVVYPLLVQGQQVYEEWGNLFGLNVQIDIRTNKPAGLWNLTSQSYESASYPVVDAKTLQSAIAKGGRNAWQPEEANAKKVQVKLGEPEMILSKVWRWDSKLSISDELFVPALRYPVVSVGADAEEWYTTKQIILPLAADLYTAENTPLPMMDSPAASPSPEGDTVSPPADTAETTVTEPQVSVEAN